MKKSSNILVAIPILTISGRERVQGVYSFAQSRPGWNVIECNESESSRCLSERDFLSAAGIVYTNSDYPGLKHLLQRIPSVKITDSDDPDEAGLSRVVVMQDTIASKAAECLIKKDLASYAFVGIAGFVYSERRSGFFENAVRSAGKECSSFFFGKFQPDGYSGELSRLADFLKSLPKPCGVMAGFDEIGRTVISVATKCGLDVPMDVSVVGVDNNLSICLNTRPPMSSVDVDFRNDGYKAAEMLDGILSGRLKPPCVAEGTCGEVVERLSSRHVATRYAYVEKARGLIRDRAMEAVDIARLAKDVGVSRRLLEMNFRKVHGRSVNREIQLCRLARLQHHLRHTMLPVDEICTMCGFSSVNYVKEFFRRETGMSMREWRKRA